MVNSPYGGKLVSSLDLNNREKHIEAMRGMPQIQPFVDFFYDSLKIGDGSYSPLDGFMGEDEVNSVVRENSLQNGLPWTIPIIFAVDAPTNNSIKEGDQIALLDPARIPYGQMAIESKFKLNKKEIAQSVYATTELKHPNVQDLFEKYGDYAISGRVKIYREPELPGGTYERHPSEVRDEFERKGWKNIVAYQARNPPHVAHEYLQKVSLEVPGIDGLFIHLVVGRLKKGDYKASVILDTYRSLITNYHRAERAMMGSLSITMRYAGPKAAIFLATIRRNYGATHYIIGRDQAGVGGYYDPYAAQKIFDELDVGMIPIRFKDTFYCRKCMGITSDSVCPHPVEERLLISQTKIRELLKNGQDIPREIIRPEIASILGKGNVINEE